MDCSGDYYVLMTFGWSQGKRVHYPVIHIDIINGKIWIQRDGTKNGIATELVEAGIPKEDIVLGFQPVYDRPYTEFAVA